MRTPTTFRRALPLVALLAAVGPAAACGQASPTGTATPAAGSDSSAAAESTGGTGAIETTGPTDGASSSGAGASASGHGVRLDASFAIGFPEQPTDPGVRKKPGIVVTYTLTREDSTAGDLVAYDVVPDALGSASLPPDVNPEHAWVYASGDAVRLSKQGFASAPGVTFLAAPTTGARVIPADGLLSGRAYAVSPAELDVPGPEFTAPREPLPQGSSTWELCVQVGKQLPGMRPSATNEGVLEAPVRAPQGDELVCTPAVTLAAP
jgi:hypothetical protein